MIISSNNLLLHQVCSFSLCVKYCTLVVHILVKFEKDRYTNFKLVEEREKETKQTNIISEKEQTSHYIIISFLK